MSASAFRCGHPKTADNLKVFRSHGFFDARCRACWNQMKRNARARENDETKRLAYRVRILPDQLAKTRAKLAKLEAEARQYGFLDLVGGA